MNDATRDSKSGLCLSADEMRQLAAAATERLIARLEGLREELPWRGAARAELEPLLREPPPEEGRDALAVVERATRDVLPIAARVDHPRFFAFVPSAPTWPGVIADYLAAGYNIFQGTWLGSGGPSQLELVVIDWFRQWVGYPETAGGLFTSGGSAAILDALVAAREQAGAPQRPAIILSDQTHAAVERAARIVGVRPDGILRVPADADFRMPMAALAQAADHARANGFTPIAVCANAGTTNTGAIDPLPEIAAFCTGRNLWLHVDAAYGGFAVLCDRGRLLLQGMALADSISLDAHKWLFQPFEAGCLLVKDTQTLVRAFNVDAEYLQDTKLGLEQVNFADRGYQLTRSFRALKVWMSIQTFGLRRFREAIARGIELAEQAGREVQATEGLELLSAPSLGVLCFHYRPVGTAWNAERVEELNKSVQAQVIDSGIAMISSTRLRGTYALRLCIMSHQTTWEDVRATIERIAEYGRRLAGA
jgi:glutamate/tyrosine decarboxylase-like PLP-dependent enzyme